MCLISISADLLVVIRVTLMTDPWFAWTASSISLPIDDHYAFTRNSRTTSNSYTCTPIGQQGMWHLPLPLLRRWQQFHLLSSVESPLHPCRILHPAFSKFRRQDKVLHPNQGSKNCKRFIPRTMVRLQLACSYSRTLRLRLLFLAAITAGIVNG